MPNYNPHTSRGEVTEIKLACVFHDYIPGSLVSSGAMGVVLKLVEGTLWMSFISVYFAAVMTSRLITTTPPDMG
jgi:hypothetical protein